MKIDSRLSLAVLTVLTVTTVAIGCARSPNGAQAKAGMPAGKPTDAPIAPKATEDQANKIGIDVAGILRDEKTSKAEKSELIAKQAELLYAAEAIVLADKTADLAIAQDPSNFRAKLLKAIIAPNLLQKGILARIIPFVGRDTELKTKFEKYVTEELKEKNPETQMMNFLMEGPSDLETDDQVKAHLERTSDALAALRDMVLDNRDKQISLNESDLRLVSMVARLKTACQVSQVVENQYVVECKQPLNVKEIVMTKEKFEQMAARIAATDLAVMIGTSYNMASKIAELKPTAATAEDDTKKLMDAMTEAIKPENENSPGFAKLTELGQDAKTAVRLLITTKWACPAGTAKLQNRLMMVVSHALCTEETYSPVEVTRPEAPAAAAPIAASTTSSAEPLAAGSLAAGSIASTASRSSLAAGSIASAAPGAAIAAGTASSAAPIAAGSVSAAAPVAPLAPGVPASAGSNTEADAE